MNRSKALTWAAACAAVAVGRVALAGGPADVLSPALPVAPAHPLMMDDPAPTAPPTNGPSLPGTVTPSGGGTTVVPAGGTATVTPGGTVVAPPGSTVIAPTPAAGSTGGVTVTQTTVTDNGGNRPMAPAPMPAPMPAPDATAAPAGPTTDASTIPTTTPLMRLLGGIGPNGGVGKAMSDAGFSVTGYVQGGYAYDFSSPTNNTITDRAFDVRHDSPELDQVELMLSRTADYTKPIDFGLTIEQIYGTDTAFFHSNGWSLVSNGKISGPFAGTGSVATIHPRAQYDPTQAYFTVTSNAVAKGIGFQGGKFATLLGYELIAPYSSGFTNPFYSHSFLFTQEPYTQTGALGILNLNETFTFKGGITRGWDQTTEDVNGDIDFMGQVAYVVNKDLTVTATGLTGNQEPDVPAGFVGHNGWRTVFDAVAAYKVSDQFTLAVNGMYAWEAQTGNAGNGGGIGQWYGAAGYAAYKFDDHVTFNARAEWFNDPDGAAPTLYSPIRRANQYYEFTLGTTIHPFPNTDLLNNFFIRPEVRFDYADKAAFDPINGGGTPSDHYFFTFSVDGVYAF